MQHNVECVELLIKAGADVNFYNRTTCLNFTDNFEIAKMLIKAGANVNSSTYEDYVTPLIGAARRGHVNLVKLYLDSGADVNCSCIFGTALEEAVAGGNPDCVKLLVRQTKNTHGPFAQAAQFEQLECLKVLLESGIDINSKISIYEQRKENKVTALMKAASGGHIACIEFLMNRGASVNMVDDYGNNVLMFASMEWKFKAMNYSIRYGIDINATNKQRETALMKVISQPYERLFLGGTGSWQQNDCKLECVRLLVESGADVNRQSASGDTALILAARQNQPEYIKILLEADSRINVFNKRSFNALMSHIEESKVKSDDLQGLLIAAGESKGKFKWKPPIVSRSIRRPKFRGCLKLLCTKGNRENKRKDEIMVSDIDWNCWLDEESNEEIHSLKELCREVILKYLLQLNPFKTLFKRAGTATCTNIVLVVRL